jgi:UDP-N-acetylglucosamine--N-acetylmuramyl-(pentapeptide) pyrophosphoryl-undecaprenol N-acetylglucosamine transferase
VIISRAGASSIAELCIVGKPTVFIPFPFASEDHQRHNALSLVNKKAALMVNDAEVSNQLLSTLNLVLNDESLQQTLSQNMKSLAVTDADQRIAQLLIQLAR